MKRFFVCFFIFCFLPFFCCCSNTKTEASASSQEDLLVLKELEQIENIYSFDDETVKALSIVIRTNNKNSNKSIEEYSPKNEHIYNIVKSTSGKILTFKNKPPVLNYNKNDDWVVSIKKFDILKFMSSKNISLSNISEIEPRFDSNGLFLGLFVAEKFLSYEELKTEFKLPSNNIKNIKNEMSSVEIFGNGYENNFDIEKADKLSKNGYNYESIINYFYEDFELKK